MATSAERMRALRERARRGLRRLNALRGRLEENDREEFANMSAADGSYLHSPPGGGKRYWRSE